MTMEQWAPEDVDAHIAFVKHVSELLKENGEYVDAQALTRARAWVCYGGPDVAPVTTDGPLPETSDLVAGWFMIDVDSHERAVELASCVSSAPAPPARPRIGSGSRCPCTTRWNERGSPPVVKGHGCPQTTNDPRRAQNPQPAAGRERHHRRRYQRPGDRVIPRPSTVPEDNLSRRKAFVSSRERLPCSA
jgi:hypothetical protein